MGAANGGPGSGIDGAGTGLIGATEVETPMRPFAVVGVLFVLFGAFGILLAALDYTSTGGACLGGRSCPAGYAGWYQAHLALWAVFGLLFLLLGLWLLVGRPRRRFAGYPPRGPGPGFAAGPYGPRGMGALRFCPQCGARNGPRFQYCHRCGSPLAGGPATPTAPPGPP